MKSKVKGKKPAKVRKKISRTSQIFLAKKNSFSNLKTKAEIIEKIYRKYSEKLNVLEKEQERVISDFLNSIKERRLQELREKVNNL